MRRLTLLVLVALVTVVAPVAAGAQSVDELAGQVESRGYAVGDGSAVDFEDLERLVADHDDVFPVSLGIDLDGGPDLLAGDILDRISRRGTVVVLTPSEVGAASSTCSNDDLNDAQDAASGRGLNDADFARVFADDLDCGGAGLGGTGDGGGSSPIGLGLLALIALVVLGGFWWWRNRQQREATEVSVAKVKAELAEDLDDVANEILQMADPVSLADDDAADEHYRSANALFLEVQEGWDSADTIDELDDIDDELDLAAWHLDAAQAILDGSPVPPRPDTKQPWERSARPAAQDTTGTLPRNLPRPPQPRGRYGYPVRSSRVGGGFGGGLLGGIVGGMLGAGLGGGGMGIPGLPRRRYGGGYSTSRRRSRPMARTRRTRGRSRGRSVGRRSRSVGRSRGRR